MAAAFARALPNVEFITGNRTEASSLERFLSIPALPASRVP